MPENKHYIKSVDILSFYGLCFPAFGQTFPLIRERLFHFPWKKKVCATLTLREKCPYLEFFWSVFSRIWSENRNLPCRFIYRS